MKFELAPSVLSFDLTRLSSDLPVLESAGAHWVHLDVMDGHFVPPITFGDAFAASCGKYTNMPLEAHLMTLTPERHFEAFAKAGCKRIIFHAEATVHAHRLIQTLKGLGILAGIAINPGTPPAVLDSVIDDLDLALVMTVNPGWGGQKFIESTLRSIETLRAARADLNIQVDGGIDPDTLPKVIAAGANVFVVGSYLLKDGSIADNVRKILTICGQNS